MAKALLHQILAVESGIRNSSQKVITELHQLCQKEPLFVGLHRTYAPIKDPKDGGVELPAERTHLQQRVTDLIVKAVTEWTKAYDIAATTNWGNMLARADVELDGKVLLKDAPVTFLLWLEHKLDDMGKFVASLPTLAADIEWEWDEKQQCYKNKHEIKTTKSEKLAYAFVKFKGDDKHPPQVDKEFKDEVVGYWTALKYSGAISVQDQKAMQERVEALQKAVKMAREKANSTEVEDMKVAAPILDYVFGDIVRKGKK